MEQATAALKEQGFGVLTTIDVQQTLKQKLDRDFRKDVILGACNPPLADRALHAELEVGLLLPCNVIVYEVSPGRSVVSAMAPLAALGIVGDNAELQRVAAEADSRLRRALTALEAGGHAARLTPAWIETGSDMRTIEIPREAWTDELNRFTSAHEGWLVSLEAFGPDIGAQLAVDQLPLIGVSADRSDHDGTITISVARSAVEHFTHVIQGVARVYIERTANGATAALLIESADGTRTIVQLRAAAAERQQAPTANR